MSIDSALACGTCQRHTDTIAKHDQVLDALVAGDLTALDDDRLWDREAARAFLDEHRGHDLFVVDEEGTRIRGGIREWARWAWQTERHK